ncbi:hypothetical protein J7E99_21545 [Streptomyces sp. ISL-44]|uniref:oligopeptide/dipeptide ABC transporter ATP-binding protein n=1 Tax=Streptomyces sp. ISL-44 TaxID=2819184 RepID=UPI001BE4F4F9|nr:hypothetical protein [Streptomyces sp. ISL-44]
MAGRSRHRGPRHLRPVPQRRPGPGGRARPGHPRPDRNISLPGTRRGTAARPAGRRPRRPHRPGRPRRHLRRRRHPVLHRRDPAAVALLGAARLVPRTRQRRRLRRGFIADRGFEHPRHPYTRALLDATPHLDAPPGPLPAIPGRPPDLRTAVTGCAFAARCARATDLCGREIPAPRAGVACHHGELPS